MGEYVCKIANLDEIIEKCNYEIDRHLNDTKWVKFKELAIKNHKENNRIVYIGKLNNKIICEATAIIHEDGFKGDIDNHDRLLSSDMVYLSAFRTNKEYEGQGYFKKLFIFMEQDLKNRGYKKMSLGVEPSEVRNMQIYFKLGFTNHIKTITEHIEYENLCGEDTIISFYYKNIDCENK